MLPAEVARAKNRTQRNLQTNSGTGGRLPKIPPQQQQPCFFCVTPCSFSDRLSGGLRLHVWAQASTAAWSLEAPPSPFARRPCNEQEPLSLQSDLCIAAEEDDSSEAQRGAARPSHRKFCGDAVYMLMCCAHHDNCCFWLRLRWLLRLCLTLI